eukprot:123503-Rhodomonas_salina.1
MGFSHGIQVLTSGCGAIRPPSLQLQASQRHLSLYPLLPNCSPITVSESVKSCECTSSSLRVCAGLRVSE